MMEMFPAVMVKSPDVPPGLTHRSGRPVTCCHTSATETAGLIYWSYLMLSLYHKPDKQPQRLNTYGYIHSWVSIYLQAGPPSYKCVLKPI